MTKPLRVSLIVGLFLALVLGLPGELTERGLAQSAEQPNIVFILTDDQDVRSVSVMSNLKSLMMDHGTTFENAFVTDPLCCPARATILRGQYSHNTGIRGNSAPEGGFEKFRRKGPDGDESTVATWLDDGGYDTFYAGKYMNGYDNTRYVPPGWDRWYGWQGNYYGSGGKYSLNENGDIKTYDRDRVHDTDLLGEKAVRFIRGHKNDDDPFFAYIATNAPHTPAYVPKRHEGMFSDRSLPRPPSFNEKDVSDKPKVVRRPEPSHTEIKDLGEEYRKRLASLQSVDGMIGDLIRTLRDTNELDNTYVVFTSDNGYLMGEHRRINKSLAYEESIRIPLVVRGPGVPAQRLEHLVTNNDFAPTFAELARVTRPGFVDGKSLVPLLGSEKPGVEAWRTGFMVEHLTPTYQALRTSDQTYVEWSGGARELYDLAPDKDPYQLRNLLGPQEGVPDPDPAAHLAERLDELRGCAGEECRSAESKPIP
jgi:N-acetylglucosamine-6-sulfatase